MKLSHRRTPKNYDGTRVTTHQVSDLLPKILGGMGDKFKERPDLILEAWPGVIGPTFATVTKAVSFNDGVLIVHVKNSTVHSLLAQHDKFTILQALRSKFPKATIKNIIFRIG